MPIWLPTAVSCPEGLKGRVLFQEMLVGATAALPSLPKVPDSTPDTCAREERHQTQLKPTRVKWHKTTGGVRQSF